MLTAVFTPNNPGQDSYEMFCTHIGQPVDLPRYTPARTPSLGCRPAPFITSTWDIWLLASRIVVAGPDQFVSDKHRQESRRSSNSSDLCVGT